MSSLTVRCPVGMAGNLTQVIGEMNHVLSSPPEPGLGEQLIKRRPHPFKQGGSFGSRVVPGGVDRIAFCQRNTFWGAPDDFRQDATHPPHFCLSLSGLQLCLQLCGAVPGVCLRGPDGSGPSSGPQGGIEPAAELCALAWIRALVSAVSAGIRTGTDGPAYSRGPAGHSTPELECVRSATPNSNAVVNRLRF